LDHHGSCALEVHPKSAMENPLILSGLSSQNKGFVWASKDIRPNAQKLLQKVKFMSQIVAEVLEMTTS
jgi:hypothetical protein